MQMYHILKVCVSRIANRPLSTHQSSTQSVQPLPNIRSRVTKHWGTYLRAHVHTCRCTPPIISGICIAIWSITTQQIWSHSAQPILSCSLATHFDTLHAARATCQGGPSNESNPIAVFTKLIYPSVKTAWKSDG